MNKIPITFLITDLKKQGYEKMVNDKIIPSMNDINIKTVHIHDKITPPKLMNPQDYGNFINNIIDMIVKKEKIDTKIIQQYSSKSSEKINTIDEFICIHICPKFIDIFNNFIKKFSNVNCHINVHSGKLMGTIDYIFDDILIDLKVYNGHDVINFRNYLQLIFYYCLCDKDINYIGIYDFYNGCLKLIDASIFDKKKILAYLNKL